MQVSVFYDHAVGRLNAPTAQDVSGYQTLRGVGTGLRFTMPGLVESKLLWATEVGGEDVGNERNLQIWGDVTYRF